jgi:hypothetical protein
MYQHAEPVLCGPSRFSSVETVFVPAIRETTRVPFRELKPMRGQGPDGAAYSP